MNLVEESQVALEALPLAAFRAHLRMGTGFGEDTLQDAVLEGFLRAAFAAIEARTGKVVLRHEFSLTLNGWRKEAMQPLPRAPLALVSAVAFRDALGQEEVLTGDLYRVEADTHVPKLRAVGAYLPRIPEHWEAVIYFSAGFADWHAVPRDLQQAVLMLAAHYYEYRHETVLTRGCMPFGVTSLLERYRPLRVGLEAL